MLQTKRVYDPPAKDDGARILVDRLWPRGATKASLQLTSWLKEVGPSDALRKWFGHDPARWAEFQRRYFAELKANAGAWQPIVQAAERGKVTLLFSAKDIAHNNAEALKAFLEGQLARQ